MLYLRRFFSQELTPAAQGDFLGCLQQAPNLLATGFPGAPALESLSWLHNLAPCFPLRGDQIQVIHEPQHFYETLVQRIGRAKRRIVLASLYLGTGQLENAVVQKLRHSLEQQSALRLNVLLDFTRGTRGALNSKTMLLPLVRDFSSQVQLSLYHTPDLRGMTKRLAPPRWNELLGLQHMKVYLFDDAVIISGANLSNDYFTNRQDRYILIEDKPLADFYAQFIERVQEFSLAVAPDATEGLHRNWRILPYEGTKEQFIQLARKRIADFVQETFQRQAQVRDQNPQADTWVFPLMEMGQIGIHHDSVVTKRLLSNCVTGSRLKLATGYFNLTQEYMDTLTHKCLAQCSILMAHPNVRFIVQLSLYVTYIFIFPGEWVSGRQRTCGWHSGCIHLDSQELLREPRSPEAEPPRQLLRVREARLDVPCQGIVVLPARGPTAKPHAHRLLELWGAIGEPRFGDAGVPGDGQQGS